MDDQLETSNSIDWDLDKLMTRSRMGSQHQEL